MTPTDEQRALADKIFWEGESFARGHDGLFGEELAALIAESEAKATAVIRGKADECWGAANYRLKYLGMLFRALGMPEDGLEGRISEGCAKITELRQAHQRFYSALGIAYKWAVADVDDQWTGVSDEFKRDMQICRDALANLPPTQP